MPTGNAMIMRMASVTGNSNYAYTWTDSEAQEDVDSVVANRTLSQAYNEIGALALAMPGTIRKVNMQITSS